MEPWREYQSQVARFFNELGLTANTDVKVSGVRTRHDIDVCVTSSHAGFELVWLVECKNWKRPVPKERVFTLRSIVDDVGADRGLMMAENGYQSGALEAAKLTNVHLSSLSELRETHAYELGMGQLRSLGPRLEMCDQRYWDIGKADRMDAGLRPDVGAGGYIATQVMAAANFSLNRAFRDGFPVAYDRLHGALAAQFGRGIYLDEVKEPATLAKTPSELFAALDAEISDLEHRLDEAERSPRPG